MVGLPMVPQLHQMSHHQEGEPRFVLEEPQPQRRHMVLKRSLLLGEGRSQEDDACKTDGTIPTNANILSQPPQTPTQPAEVHEVNPSQLVSAESIVPKTNQAQCSSTE